MWSGRVVPATGCVMTVAALVLPDLSIPLPPIPGGPIKLGSDEHKALFCEAMLTTFDPYRPAVIDWPKLTPDTQEKITSLPIRDIAVQTEGKAGLRVATYGDLISDPLLKRATQLIASEERRHKHALHHMVQAYRIKLEPETEYLVPTEAGSGA